MDAKKLDAIIRKEVDDAVCRAYSEGYLCGFMDCLTEKQRLFDSPERKLLAMPTQGEVQ